MALMYSPHSGARGITLLRNLERDILPTLLHHASLWKGVRVDSPPPQVYRAFIKPGDPNVLRHLDVDYEISEDWQLLLHKFTDELGVEHEKPHSHPWPLAVHILRGTYDMHYCRFTDDGVMDEEELVVSDGDYYEMNEPCDGHALLLRTPHSYSVCLRGAPFGFSPHAPDVASNPRLGDLELLLSEFRALLSHKS